MAIFEPRLDGLVDHFACLLLDGSSLVHTFGRIDTDHRFASSVHDVDPPVRLESFDTFNLGAFDAVGQRGYTALATARLLLAVPYFSAGIGGRRPFHSSKCR